MIGGVAHDINAAHYGQQTFVNGSAQRRNLNLNRMIRPQEAPTVKVPLLPPPAHADRRVPIGGIGELRGVPTLTPVLAGALSRLTDQAVRALPLFPIATMSD